jgi:hypothetical protein
VLQNVITVLQQIYNDTGLILYHSYSLDSKIEKRVNKTHTTQCWDQLTDNQIFGSKAKDVCTAD